MSTLLSRIRLRNALARPLTRLLTLLGLVGFAALSACGGGSAGSGLSSAASTNTGSTVVTLTDAQGPFLHYMVNVTSIQLTRADGTTVETLPTSSTPVDFVGLVDLSEIISAQDVPQGNYTAVDLTLDYANAQIILDNGTASGLTVPSGQIYKDTISTGSALAAPNPTTVTLSLKFPTSAPLVVTPGHIANLALDFNLSTANTVAPATLTSSTSASSVSVTVLSTGSLAASLTPDTSKQIRVRGPLVSVDTTASTYTVQVRPFFNATGTHGQVVVNTTSTTAYTINGTSATGSAGLTALAALPANTLIAAYGTLDVASKTFTATTVLAGSSVTGSTLDGVEGTVIARSGNVLTVSNALVCAREQGGVGFDHTVAVTVAASGSSSTGTSVTEDGQTGTFTVTDISVGQHIQAFGTLAKDSSGNVTLDASAGSVRLMTTTLWGLVSSTPSGGSVTLNLQSIDGRNASVFNFAGTGATSAQDATAAAYVVSVPQALSLTGIATGTAVRFAGFVTPFGAAPPDFAALSLANYAATNAHVGIEWATPGLTAPFVSPLSASNVLINQANVQSAVFHLAQTGPQRVDLSTITAGISFVPNASASSTAYIIGHWKSHTEDTFASFGDWVTALNTDLNGTTALLGIAADGPFNASTGVVSVNKVAAVLGD